jgi:hypothetical protein
LWANVEDLAEFVFEQITSKDWKKKAPLVAAKKLKTPTNLPTGRF